MSYLNQHMNAPLSTSRVKPPYPDNSPIMFVEDFMGTTGRQHFDVDTGDADWKLGGTNATVASTSILFLAAEGGWLKLITTGTSGDECFIIGQSSMVPITYSTTAPRAFSFQARLYIDTITSSNAYAGATAASAVNGTTDPVDTQPNGFAFLIADGVVKVAYKTSAVTVAPAAVTYLEGPNQGSAVTMVAGSSTAATTFGIDYDGKGGLQFFVNGYLVKEVTLASHSTINAVPCFGLDTGATATPAMFIDKIYMAAEPVSGGRL